MYFLKKQTLVKAYKLAAHLLFGLLLVFVLVNGVFYFFTRFQGTKNEAVDMNAIKRALTNPFLNQLYPDLNRDELMVLLKETWGRPYAYEAFTQFKERKFRGKYVNVDRAGFRVSKNQGVWPPAPNNYNVFLFGGSTTFGYGVPDHQTIASYLQEKLREKSTKDVCVYNFGRGFYFPFQEKLLFEKLLISGHIPDMAIFIDGINNPTNNISRGTFFTPRFGRTLGKPPHFLSKLQDKTRSVFNALPVIKFILFSRFGKESEAVGKGVFNPYLLNKQFIEAVSAVYKVTPVFVWQPTHSYHYDLNYYFMPENRASSHNPKRHEYEIMAELIKKEKFGDNFLWCADIQENIQEPLYVDICHYSPKMSKMFAETIAEMLIEKNIFE